jgi:hypothetical protein
MRFKNFHVRPEFPMSPSPRRSVALLLLVAYLPQISGCQKTAKVEPTRVEPLGQEPILGVTRLDGERVQFDAAGYLAGDSAHGQVNGAAVAIPLDSVRQVSVRRDRTIHWLNPSRLKTLGQRVVGATTLDGSQIAFDQMGGYVRGDTVFATRRGEPLRLPLNQVQRLWVRKTDAALTTLALVGGLAAVLLVAAAIDDDESPPPQESCPFIYSWDGTQYVFDAEPYGGAISRGLERNDYARLESLRPENGLYKLLVTNEVKETQMTNLMELWVVDHAPGVRVLPDIAGGLYLLSQPIPPASARDQQGHDLLAWLRATDRKIWEPLAVADPDGGMRDEIVLTFPKPREATAAGLVTNVATGTWGSHMIRAMLQLRGRDVEAWYARIDGGTHSRDSLMAWDLREELYHLRVDVREPDGWRTRAILPGGGPLIAEDRVIPLDLRGIKGDSVRLRIRPPRGFWALNSFALDYGGERPSTVDTLRPIAAKDARWGNVLPALSASDDRYYAMPRSGDRGYVDFRAPPPRPGLDRTVLLHTRGYYRLHLPMGGEPDTATLRRISYVPGAAAEFAAQQFSRWQVAER